MIGTRIILSIFLTIASIGFAADAVHREVSTGEPAIRGLVHAAIGGLIVILLWHGNTLAQTFGVYALIGAAFGVDDEILAVFMLVAATEAVVHHQVVPEATYALAALVSLIPDTASDAAVYVFHTAFLCALGSQPDTKGVFVLSCATLAVQQAVVAPTTVASWALAIGALRGLISIFLRSRDDIHETSGTVVHPHWVYWISSVAYGAVLWADASTRHGTAQEELTRFIHVAAVVAALIAVLPAWTHAYPTLRPFLALFPLTDVVLCAYRLREESSLLWCRAAAAVVMFGAIAFLPHTSSVVLSTDSPASPVVPRRIILVIFALVHAAYAAQVEQIEDAVGAVFHHLVVILSVCALALEWGDATCRRIALVFVACEAIGAAQLAIFEEETLWMAAFALTSLLMVVQLVVAQPSRDIACFFKPPTRAV